MKTSRVIVFILSFLLVLPLPAKRKTYPLTEKLEDALRMRPSYDSYFRGRIVQLQELRRENAHELRNRALVDFRLAGEFAHHSADSALAYIGQVLDASSLLGDIALHFNAEMFQVYLYAKAGYFLEAQQILDRYDLENLDTERRYSFYYASYVLSGVLRTLGRSIPSFLMEPDSYLPFLIEHTPRDTYRWYNFMHQEMHRQGKVEDEQHYLRQMLKISVEGTHDYAVAAYLFSQTCVDEELQLYWLTQSAVSDIISSTKDYVALNQIAVILFQHGEIDRAFRYTADYCMPDALYYNGKTRPVQIAEFFSSLEKEHGAGKELAMKKQKVSLIFSALLIFLCLSLLIIIFSRNKVLTEIRNKLSEARDAEQAKNRRLEEVNGQLQELNMKLREADQVKEQYISLFLGILSENIDTSRKYKNHVLRNLRKGNVEQLEEEIESLPPIDQDIDAFYKMFDQTFINMYPDYVAKFNSLLQDGEEVCSKNPDVLLSPEQRIFALIKLGITDPSRIASLLHYSTNTIYNYKAKIKNKARGDRNKFEEDLCNLI